MISRGNEKKLLNKVLARASFLQKHLSTYSSNQSCRFKSKPSRTGRQDIALT